MSVHVYPASAMYGDYLRAAAGFAPAAAILAALRVGPAAAVVLGAVALLFGVFGLRTAVRHLTRIECTEIGIVAAGPRPRAIAWDGLDDMRLAYYATARDRRNGWMQLDLRAGATRLQLDSRIDGFAELVGSAADAALSRDLPLSDATLANLEALGVVGGRLPANRALT